MPPTSGNAMDDTRRERSGPIPGVGGSRSIKLLAASVQGASHRRSGLPCQDSYAIRDRRFRYSRATHRNGFYHGMGSDVLILAAADGHGSSACPYSKHGSRFAVNTFCDIMAESCFKYRQDMAALLLQLKRESDVMHLARAIDMEWKRRALRDYNTNKKKLPLMEELAPEGAGEDSQKAAVYRLYGTTLLGVLITDTFLFSYQLGDGDISYIDHEEVSPLVEQDAILGVETHSLSKPGAWRNAHTSILSLPGSSAGSCMYMLSTDGMVNSFVSRDEFRRSCQGYLDMLDQHGAEAVEKHLPSWLRQTSEEGCGDDITAVIAYVS